MTIPWRWLVSSGVLFCVAACTSDDRGQTSRGATAGSAGVAGATASGAGAEGGIPPITAAAGGAGAIASAAGGAGAGPRGFSGASGAEPAAAGRGTVTAGAAGGGGAGASGAGATAGAAGGKATMPVPSAGCMKMGTRPAGGSVAQADRIYRFPASYDGKTPLPLLLGLHAAGNPVTQIQTLTDGSRLDTNFVRVFPKSAGSAWVYNTDITKLTAVLDDVLASYCIDTSRMFATGHSSGAQMVVQMLCNGEKRLKAVAPVAASKYCAKLSPVAVMYIQGMMDAQRGGGNGMDVVSVFATSNACGAAATPKTDVASCMSTFDRKQVNPGCLEYPGCTAPTIWCSHDDNGYNNTDGRQHGWPCFASNAIADFFMRLP